MFIQSCFIRKSTPELQKELERLGYKKSKYSYNEDSIATSRYANSYCIITEELYDDPDPRRTWDIKERIDCGDNEELFLALAALRDDTDKYQWFTDGNKWIQCPEKEFLDVLCFWDIGDIDENKIHQATVEELIEHFK